MPDVHALVSVLACTLFTGAALYINLVEHPARMACGTEIAARQWAPSYRRATWMQATLAIVAAATGLILWNHGGGALWGVGALLIGLVVPVTLIVIYPTNKRLLEPGRDLRSAETAALLNRWAALHAIRTVLGLAASIVYLWALGGR
jgi:hypothetical protein